MRIFILLIVFVVSPAFAQEIYRWKDAKGRVHYGEVVPESGNYERLSDDVLPHVHSLMPVKMPKISPRVTPSQKVRNGHSGQRTVVTRRNNVQSKKSLDVQCGMYRRELESIQRQLRAGYKEPKGNHLRAARRQVEEAMRKEC